MIAMSTDPFSLLGAAREAPNRLALIFDGEPFSYARLGERVSLACERWRGLLAPHRARLPGVALVARHELDTFVAIYALCELEVPVLLIHPRLGLVELARLLADARPLARVGANLALELEDVNPPPPGSEQPGRAPAQRDEAALAILYTSGTSGQPKGAVLSRRAFAHAVAASAKNLAVSADDRWLLMMPLAHVGGLSILLRCLAARACVVTANPPGPFDPARVIAALERERVTLVSMVPTMLKRMLDHPANFRAAPRLRAVLLGGAAAPARLLESAAQRAIPVLTTYGMTEACSQITTQPLGTPPSVAAGCGIATGSVELRLRGGEIELRGRGLLSGYWREGALHPALDADGWFATGDHGHVDEGGRLHLLCRRIDLIVTGGENVYPAEVEAAIERYPGVAAACVFGVPDAEWGALVSAVIVPERRTTVLDGGGLAAHLCANLATHKRPRLLALARALPTSPAGKLDRAGARELHQRGVQPFDYHAPAPLRLAAVDSRSQTPTPAPSTDEVKHEPESRIA